MVLALVTVLLQPWHGKDLPTATAAAAKYQLTIKDAPGSNVELQAAGVAQGWIAAFCDSRTCSPMQVTKMMPASGKLLLQFELIREDDSSAKTSGAVIRDGRTGYVLARVRPSSAAHVRASKRSHPAR